MSIGKPVFVGTSLSVAKFKEHLPNGVTRESRVFDEESAISLCFEALLDHAKDKEQAVINVFYNLTRICADRKNNPKHYS